MYFKTSDIKTEASKWTIFEKLYSRRLAETNKKRVMNLISPPDEMMVGGLSPEYYRLPLYYNLPAQFDAPSGAQYTRGRLGENLLRPGKRFDLSDPYCRIIKFQYDYIHDPNLKNFFLLNQINDYLQGSGTLTDEEKVKCDLKTFNAYRQYLWTKERLKIRKELDKYEIQNFQKHLFRHFLIMVNDTKRNYLQLMPHKNNIIRRKLSDTLNRIIRNVANKLLLKRCEIGTARVKQKMAKLWNIHLANQKAYPIERANRMYRTVIRGLTRPINYIIKWENHAEWETERDELILNCRELNNVLVKLKWDRKIQHQKLLLMRDFLIHNDFLRFSDRRKRLREKMYELDRKGMEEKYRRIRLEGGTSFLKKKVRDYKYETAADYLLGTFKDGLWRPKGPELEEMFTALHQQKGRWKLPRCFAPRNKKRRFCRIGNYGAIRGRLLLDSMGGKISLEYIHHLTQRFAYRRLRRKCGASLAIHLKYMKNAVGLMKCGCKQGEPKLRELARRYDWCRKLPFKAILENHSPKEVTKQKLIVAVKRFMKYEKRRVRTTHHQ